MQINGCSVSCRVYATAMYRYGAHIRANKLRDWICVRNISKPALSVAFRPNDSLVSSTFGLGGGQ